MVESHAPVIQSDDPETAGVDGVEEKNGDWQIVWSDSANRPYYFNRRTLVGTFSRPPNMKIYFFFLILVLCAVAVNSTADTPRAPLK
jgi:hypothetical protein